jgi:hypothetical protein
MQILTSPLVSGAETLPDATAEVNNFILPCMKLFLLLKRYATTLNLLQEFHITYGPEPR